MGQVGIKVLKDHLSEYLRRAPVDTVWRQAGDLTERHGLRGAGSVHLASYLSLIGRQAGLPVLFSSFDERLNLAARREAGEG